MHPHRRRKKRPNYGIRTVEVARGPNGFGFTISGQQPCILSCIVANSPADQAGLRAGDFLISVNGLSVSKITHDAVVKLIGNSFGPIKMSIAEYYYSDSSDEELDASRIVNNRKPKYMHKPRTHRKVDDSPKKFVKKPEPEASTSTVQIPNEETIEYKSLVGYLGTIEMPKQLLPSSRLQTVCSCIRKLRQEKRTPSAVLMTVLPSCLSLKNSNNQILAIFPASRVVYISSSADKDSRYFGLVTSAVQQVEVSNSCHVFVTDPKLTDHGLHMKKAETFNITCTPDIITGNCLEFPKNSLYVVSLVQNMYRLQSEAKAQDENVPLVANSPQPSASSNSDSGIGFRDEGAVSDRILVVEFPAPRPQPAPAPPAPRPAAVRGDHDLRTAPRHAVLNVRATSTTPAVQPSNTTTTTSSTSTEMKPPSGKLHRLTVRAMPDPVLQGDADSGQVFRERAVDVTSDEPQERSPTQLPWAWDKAYRTHSCGDLADNAYHKQLPKVMSGESASLADLGDCGFGSLAQLSWGPPAALSEPDVRLPRSRSQDLLLAVVNRILLLWDSLQLYFTNLVFENKDLLHTESGLLENLKNPIYKAYILFLSYILDVINQMNLQFQSETTQIHTLYTKFTSVYKLVLKNFIKKTVIDTTDLSNISPSNPDYYLKLEELYLGANVAIFFEQHSIDPREVKKFRVNILSFYVELCTQIRKRFNFNDKFLQFLTKFQPKVAMSGNIPSIVEASSFFKKVVTDVEKLNNEWRQLSEITELKQFENLPFGDFWFKVFEIKNEMNEEMFPHLNKLIKAVICLPHSSASAERIFSKLNLIKTDVRNRLNVETCCSELMQNESHDTCYTWQPSLNLI